jgi:two-component system, OmpR family, phosphate regulon sensor histidine kinase PhoR
MRKRNTVLILGIFSILILVSIQVYIIRGIWEQKDEMFSLRYTTRSQEGFNYIRRSYSTDGFDTVRILLNNYADKAIYELSQITDQQEIENKKKEIQANFTYIVNKEQDLSGLLASYFDMRGLEKNFNYSIVINNLELLNTDTIRIYQSESFARRGAPERGRRMLPTEVTSSKIFINWFWLEGNHYRLNLDYWIDFSDKQKVILRETSTSLVLSILSIVLVGIMFIITYRNLTEEKRLSNLKTDFINNMTHELKTPLSTITVAGKTLEMAQIRTNEAKILETARLIGKQSVHLNQLINMILEISMWERTQFQLDKKTVDIEEMMHEVVFSFKSGGGNGATITENYNFSGTKVDLDVVYFTTLINNLLSNAVKYSDKVPVIEIEGFVDENNISLSISDNGIGISKNDQKHIFDKFYRASSGNIHKFKGLGLGLYYVKKIAVAHGGDVSVSSKPGKGSIFTLTLPLNQ